MRSLLFSLFLFPVVAFAYVNPGAPQGFVNDFANLFTVSERAVLEAKLVQFEKETSNEIAVAIISDLGGDTIENFAEKLFVDWKIGKEGKDNGILLLVSRDDREVRIEVGYGLEGALTDAQSGWIISNEIVPMFREGRYAEGVGGAVEKMMAATRGEYVPSESGSSQDFSSFSPYVIVVFFFGLSVLSHLFGRTKSWWLGGVFGGVAGIVIGLTSGSSDLGIGAFVLLVPLGLLIDFWASRAYLHKQTSGAFPWWWWGGHGGSGHGGGGGFGGFGGGHSGGGGASGRW